MMFCVFFFKQKTAYEMRISDWSSDVCSSDLDNVLHSAEKSVAEFGDKVSAAERKAIEDDIAALKAALGNDDADAIRAKVDALQQSSMKLGEAMYKAQQEDAAAADGDSGGSAKAGDDAKAADDVVDADFEEIGRAHV